MRKIVIYTSEQGSRLMGGKPALLALRSIDSVCVLSCQPASGAGQEKSDADAFLVAWETLRTRLALCTRYNGPNEFTTLLGAGPDGHFQPLSLGIYEADKLIGVVFSKLGKHKPEYKVGPVRIPGRPLTALWVSESAVIADDSEDWAKTLSNAFDEISSQSTVQLIKLDSLSTTSPLYPHLDIAGNGNQRRMIRKNKVRWRTQLLDPVSGETVTVHSTKTRSTRQRQDRKLVREFNEDVELRTFDDATGIPEFIAESASIVEKTYQAAMDIGVSADDPTLAPYLEKLANEGCFRGYLLRCDGKSIAYVLGDVQSGVFYLWATSFLPEFRKLSPGTVLINRLFTVLSEEKTVWFDFGHGDSVYKRNLGSHMIEESDFSIYDGSLTVGAQYFTNHAAIKIDGFLREKLSADVLEKARKIWRSLLTKRKAG